MPMPNYHSARIAEPLPQESSIFATKQIAPGITVILQRLKSGGSMQAQSYRFSKHQFTSEEAKEWLKKHNITYKLFEPASSTSEGQKETREQIIKRITNELSGAIIA